MAARVPRMVPVTLVATTVAISSSSQTSPKVSPLLLAPVPLEGEGEAEEEAEEEASAAASEPHVLIPALLIQTSILPAPRASAALAANFLASPGLETSHGAAKIREEEEEEVENLAPSSLSASATLDASREQNATSSPAARNSSTRALPIPLDPPVTTTRSFFEDGVGVGVEGNRDEGDDVDDDVAETIDDNNALFVLLVLLLSLRRRSGAR